MKNIFYIIFFYFLFIFSIFAAEIQQIKIVHLNKVIEQRRKNALIYMKALENLNYFGFSL